MEEIIKMDIQTCGTNLKDSFDDGLVEYGIQQWISSGKSKNVITEVLSAYINGLKPEYESNLVTQKLPNLISLCDIGQQNLGTDYSSYFFSETSTYGTSLTSIAESELAINPYMDIPTQLPTEYIDMDNNSEYKVVVDTVRTKVKRKKQSADWEASYPEKLETIVVGLLNDIYIPNIEPHDYPQNLSDAQDYFIDVGNDIQEIFTTEFNVSDVSDLNTTINGILNTILAEHFNYSDSVLSRLELNRSANEKFSLWKKIMEYEFLDFFLHSTKEFKRELDHSIYNRYQERHNEDLKKKINSIELELQNQTPQQKPPTIYDSVKATHPKNENINIEFDIPYHSKQDSRFIRNLTDGLFYETNIKTNDEELNSNRNYTFHLNRDEIEIEINYVGIQSWLNYVISNYNKEFSITEFISDVTVDRDGDGKPRLLEWDGFTFETHDNSNGHESLFELYKIYKKLRDTDLQIEDVFQTIRVLTTQSMKAKINNRTIGSTRKIVDQVDYSIEERMFPKLNDNDNNINNTIEQLLTDFVAPIDVDNSTNLNPFMDITNETITGNDRSNLFTSNSKSNLKKRREYYRGIFTMLEIIYTIQKTKGMDFTTAQWDNDLIIQIP